MTINFTYKESIWIATSNYITQTLDNIYDTPLYNVRKKKLGHSIKGMASILDKRTLPFMEASPTRPQSKDDKSSSNTI